MAKGVDIVGFFKAETGLGEAARLLANALRAADYPVSTINVTTGVARNNNPFKVDDQWKYDHLIMAVNSSETPLIMNIAKPPNVEQRYVIGQWFWETDKFPPSMRIGYSRVNEIWAPTKFITSSIANYAPQRVTVNTMPLPLLQPLFDPEISKVDIGVDPSRYVFLFTFSFYSVFGRKNPLATINSFKKAFKNEEGPVLVIKSINGNVFSGHLATMKQAAADRTDIKFIDDHLDVDKLGSLLNIADCYVSLHRSEGLGLTISESMALGKPVIATNYSGNTDFMDENTSILIPWQYTTAGRGCEPYPEDTQWAEADVDAAVEAMRYVYNNQDKAKLMGQRAKKHLEANFSLEKTGKRMAEYLNSL